MPNNFQKVLIEEIISKRVFDLESFFDVHFLETDPAKKANAHKITIYPINCSPEECISGMVDFLALWKKLEDAKLIYTAIDSSKTELFNFFSSNYPNQSRPPSTDFVINQITRDYFQKVIYPLFDLQIFKDNNYKTDQEIYSKSEERHRSIGLWTAIVFGIVSIFLQVITSVTSTNERDVKIKNPLALPETTKVFILNPESLGKIPASQIIKQDSTSTKKIRK